MRGIQLRKKLTTPAVALGLLRTRTGWSFDGWRGPWESRGAAEELAMGIRKVWSSSPGREPPPWDGWRPRSRGGCCWGRSGQRGARFA
jgi:hypothetical protein